MILVGTPEEDPGVRRMLASHVHCAEPMQLIHVADQPLWADASETLTTAGMGPVQDTAMYQCACGFRLDEEQFAPD